jgi:NOL1/NOP2/sun family putative RNA methylase
MAKTQTFIERAAEVWALSPTQVLDILSLPTQKAVRLNPLKAKKTTLTSLAKQKIILQPIKWAPDCYSVISGYELVSKTKEFIHGEIVLQDSASFVPTFSLEPKPTERILDVCAAPGMKTTHIAALSDNKATITANDSSKTRFFKLRDILELHNIAATATLHDARFLHIAFKGQQFDKILLDAPCSGEAAIRPEEPKTYSSWSMAKIKRLSTLQKKLIAEAYDKLAVGGCLVYSTCTIAPEENEAVVNYLLKKRPGAHLVPVTVKPDDARNGLATWQGKEYSSELAKACRLLPSTEHEAFFTAKIVKANDSYAQEDFYRR